MWPASQVTQVHPHHHVPCLHKLSVVPAAVVHTHTHTALFSGHIFTAAYMLLGRASLGVVLSSTASAAVKLSIRE